MNMIQRIDLSRLAPPDVVATLNFEDIYQEMRDEFRRRYPEWTAVLESDPATKLLEVAAYREMQIQARINDAARAVMLAYAGGSDLDHLAALLGVKRLPAEQDERLRARTQLSLESLSTAGPTLAYVFHALSASNQVRDVQVLSPQPGYVNIIVLAEGSPENPDGIPDTALLAAVEAKVSAEEVRPLTDFVTVLPAEVIHYTVQAELFVSSRIGEKVVLDDAKNALQTYVDEQFGLGRDVTVSGLHAAMHRHGVTRVDLVCPTETLIVAPHQAARCDGFDIVIAGVAI